MSTVKSDIQAFLKVAKELSDNPRSGLSKTNISSLRQIVKKSAGFDGNDIESWLSYISKPVERKQSRSGGRVSMPETTDDLVALLVANLRQVSADSAAYEKLADKINREHRSDTLKKIAQTIVAGSKPTRKSEALRIIKAGRRSENFAESKQTEARASSPW